MKRILVQEKDENGYVHSEVSIPGDQVRMNRSWKRLFIGWPGEKPMELFYGSEEEAERALLNLHLLLNSNEGNVIVISAHEMPKIII